MDNATQGALGINKPINPPPPTEGNISQQATALQGKMSNIESQANTSLAELKPAAAPQSEFHPLPPKDTSQLASIMMVMGALAGRSTMTPMTAALNNISAVMKGQHEGNAEMVAAQKEEFKINFDAAMQANKQYIEQKDAILQKYHYDMGAAQGELQTLKLEHGISDSVMKNNLTATKNSQQAMAKAMKLASDLGLLEKKIAATGSVEQKKLEAKYRSDAEKELAKTTDATKIAAINDRLMKNLQTLNVAPAAPAPAAAGAIPDRPSSVPADAKYSPSNKSWWWQVNGQWHSDKSQ